MDERLRDRRRTRTAGRAVRRLILEGASPPLRLGVLVCVGLVAAALVTTYPQAVIDFGRDAKGNSALDFADREFAGGNAVVVDQQAMYEARARIAVDETYRVELGPNLARSGPLTESSLDEFVTYFLLPRRPALEPDWLICYGCDLPAYEREYDVVWQNDDGISLAQRRR